MGDTKTIFYIGGFELPDKNAAAHRVLNIGKILRKLGYNVVFIGISRTDKKVSMNKPSLEKVEGFDSWCISYPRNIFEWIKYTVKIEHIKKIVNQYNGIHSFICYNYQSVAFYQIIKYSKQNGIKVLSDTTEWYGNQGVSILRGIIKSVDTNIRMKILNKKVNGLIAISDYLYNYYKNSVLTISIPPLVDKSENKWEMKRLNDEKEITFVYAGSPGKSKDKINLLISSLKDLPDDHKIKLKIVGISQTEYLKIYPDEVDVFKQVKENVEFLGRKSHTETLRIIYNADFTIFFREKNRINTAGFPTKFVESLSCSVPVVTNSSSNIKQYLVDGQNGYIIPNNDISLILSKILKMSSEARREMKNNIDSNEFDYNNFIYVFKDFFNNLK